MRLYCVETGSRANTFVLSSNDGESLILDAGVPITKVLPHIPDWRKIRGCLITHEHADHSRASAEYIRRGIRCIASRGTWDALHHDVEPVGEMQQITLGGFTVLPFGVQHDAAEPFGYLVKYNPTGETLLYATDTYYLRFTFPRVHYWLVECNHCEDLIDAETDAVLRNRLKRSHMSLRRLRDALAKNDLRETAQIVLMHLSDTRSDEARMCAEIEAQTGIPTTAADNEMAIDLERTPF